MAKISKLPLTDVIPVGDGRKDNATADLGAVL